MVTLSYCVAMTRSLHEVREYNAQKAGKFIPFRNALNYLMHSLQCAFRGIEFRLFTVSSLTIAMW
jgi:hypothetical protein